MLSSSAKVPKSLIFQLEMMPPACKQAAQAL